MFAVVFHNVANLLFLRIGQVQPLEHHIVTRAHLTFVMMHHFTGRLRGVGGSGGRRGCVCRMSQISRAQSQSRSNKQCS